MAWTADDVATLEASIVSGVQEVRFADGRTVRYATMTEKLAALAAMRASLQTSSSRSVLAEVNRRG